MTTEKNNKIGLRVGLSAGLLVIWGLVNSFLHSAAPLVSGELAAQQLKNSNSSYFVSQSAGFFTGEGLPAIILVALLLTIWWAPLKRSLSTGVGVTALAVMLALSGTTPAKAYFNVKDNEENIEILPNQSAFLIPEVGDNKDSQVAFMSKEYLIQKKMAQKRVNIPHTTMHMAGVFNRDYYIPSARLVLVDRTPYYRQWVAGANKGTSNKDESFPFEDGNSINISTGITIAAHVTEENAPLYLYSVGTNPNHKPYINPGDPEDLTPQEQQIAAQFSSVIYGQDLETVMDTVIWGKVETVLAREYGSRALLNIIGEDTDKLPKKAEIIAIVEKEVTAFAATYGITIDFLGYAGSLTYDAPVQEAINNVFIAKIQNLHTVELQNTMAIKNQYANIAIKDGIAKSFADKGVGPLPAINIPSIIWLPGSVMDRIESWLGWSKDPTPTVTTAAPSK